MEVYTNKTSIELVMTAIKATAANTANLAVAAATATSILPQLATAVADGLMASNDAISLGIREGIAALADANLNLLARIRQLQGRRKGETALEYYERLKKEAAAEQPSSLPKEAANN